MGIEINKHGLPRTISSEIRAEIRKTDGYGCVKCGNIFIQYEHIDPLYCDATRHDPDHITLLCNGCHGESTGKRLPKRIIYQLKKNPFCKKNGFAEAKFYPNPCEMKIEFGKSTFSNTDIALTVFGKPIIWVSKDLTNEDSPLLYNAIFMDSNENKIGYLNKNQFIGLIGDCDFQAISSRIEVRLKKGEINLILEIEGDKILKIKRIFFKYFGATINLDVDGCIKIGNNNSFSKLGEVHTHYCLGGLSIYDIPHQPTPFNKLYTSILFGNSKKVSNIFGKHCGFLLNDKIFDLNFSMVAKVNDNEVFNLINEYIGNLSFINKSQIHIIMEKDEYPDHEPIWVSEKNRSFFFLQSSITIDTSYRLFGLENTSH